jgi:hypothetical protein
MMTAITMIISTHSISETISLSCDPERRLSWVAVPVTWPFVYLRIWSLLMGYSINCAFKGRKKMGRWCGSLEL